MLYGASGNDLLIGEAGNDRLDGEDGNDDMRGGAGNDVYYVDSKDDKVTELAGQGIDRIVSTIAVDLAAANGNNVEELLLAGSGNINGSGNKLNNLISGNSGDNTLFGGLGNDTLQGNGGTDILIGAEGNDRYLLVDVTDSITEFENNGIDEVVAISDYTLGMHLENLTLGGTGDYSGGGNKLNNVITGNDNANFLIGFEGNDLLIGAGGDDRLDGATGSDTMRGGVGSDVYYVDNAGDKVIEDANEGTDEVISLLSSYTLGGNVDGLSFDVGAVNVLGKGNALENDIFADAGNDQLEGLGGNDRLYGREGNDQLSGGDGRDTLYGETGNDTLNGGAGNDELIGGAGIDTLAGGSGDDTYVVTDGGDVIQEIANGGIDFVGTTVNLTLSAFVENVGALGMNLTINGNELDNVMNGNSSAADTLNGGKGADRIRGFGGADVLNGDDGNDVIEGGLGADTINGGAGNDLIQYTLADPNDLTNLGGDLIKGFETGKDTIDLYDLFTDFGVEITDPIGSGYLKLEVNGSNTVLSFDKDGGADGFVTLARFESIANITLADLIYPQAVGIE